MQLKEAGIKRVTIAVNHLAHLIQSYFDDGLRWGVEIDYSLENKPLSTIAPLKLIRDLPENFFVMNGDVLTDLPILELYKYHCNKDSDITVATFKREEKIDFGVLKSDEDCKIIDFKEKPIYNFQVSMGIYVINKRLLEFIPNDTPYGFDDLLYDCIKNNRKAYSFQYSGQWLDIGRPDDYSRAQDEVSTILDSLGVSF
jgi:NDP-sugar pyrophosphorylase family protein